MVGKDWQQLKACRRKSAHRRRRLRSPAAGSVSVKGTDGLPLFRWADIDVAPRSHVEKGIQGERRQIANDCFALAMKIEHYNAKHPTEEPLQIPFNFEEDIEEMKIAKGVEDDAA
jgi:hypothetical protein